jgi:hypothetical protein
MVNKDLLVRLKTHDHSIMKTVPLYLMGQKQFVENNILTPTRILFNVKINTMYHFKYYHSNLKTNS